MFCRLCFGELKDFVSIFVGNGESPESAIAKLIKKQFSLKPPIEKENVEFNKICTSCWCQLHEFHQFCLRIEQKQETLQWQSSNASPRVVIKNEVLLEEEEVEQEECQQVKVEPEIDIMLDQPQICAVAVESYFNNPAVEELNAPQLNITRQHCATSVHHNSSLPSMYSESKKRKLENNVNNTPNLTFNEEALGLLKTILNKQNKLEQQMENIEKNLRKTMIDRNEMLTQSKLTQECKIMVKQIQESVCRMTGEIQDEVVIEIASTLPLTSVDAVLDIEAKLQNQEYVQAMTIYLQKLKGTSEDVNAVVRMVFSDDLLQLYNWDGKWERKSLVSMKLVDQILFGVFQIGGRHQFEKEVKKAIELAHNRHKQKKRLKKKALLSTTI